MSSVSSMRQFGSLDVLGITDRLNGVSVVGTIGIPCGERPRSWEFIWSLMRLRRPGPGPIAIKAECGNDIVANRNALVRRMEGDWLWMIDDDHGFADDVLLKLLARNVPIVQALCPISQAPFLTTAFRREADGFLRAQPVTSLPLTGLVEVDACGTAGMLIRKHVFDKLGDPWFRYGSAGELREDLDFCNRAKAAGISVHVDLDARTWHQAPQVMASFVQEEGVWKVALRQHDGGLAIG